MGNLHLVAIDYCVRRRVAKIYTDMNWIDVGTAAHYAHTKR